MPNQTPYVPRPTSSKLDISTQTVIKASPGKLFTVSVTTAGTTAGTVNDSATISGVAASNLVGSFEAVGNYPFNDWPFANGIVITPGTGQVLSVSFS